MPSLHSRCLVEGPCPNSTILHVTGSYDRITIVRQMSALAGPRPSYGRWSPTQCPRMPFTANSITRLVELADPNCAIKTSSSVTWRASTFLHSPGETLAADRDRWRASELRLFTVSHKLHRSNGEAPSSSSPTMGWAMRMMNISFGISVF